tara:strand:+ start:324 stop:992 length:669 start_codon:yes stop_codon:yes gene_type:complete
MQQLNSSTFIEKLRFNEKGLIPVIAQDWLDGAVLMLAWMNRAAIEKTLKSREVHYWSRSRNEIWHKGATSGNKQILKSLRYDCDLDTILITIEQTGPGACHTGERSCFFLDIEGNKDETISKLPPVDSCSELFKTIESRKLNPVENSYTNQLIEGGDNQILKKVGEESAEFIMSCKDKDPKSIANEAADLIFHVQVAMSLHGVSWNETLKVLAERRGAPRRK